MIQVHQGATRALQRVFRSRKHMHVIDWADKYFKLPPESSNNRELVDWKTFGYQKLQLHAFCDLDTVDTFVKKPTQVGGTKALSIASHYECAHRMRSNAFFLPTAGDANTFSNVEIKSVLKHVPEVRNELIVDHEKKDSDNTTKRRGYKGAQQYCRGTQTLQDVSSIPIESAFADEVSKMPLRLKNDKGEEGKAPLDGIRGRMDAATAPSLSGISTCTEQGTCQITHEFEQCEEKFHRGFFCPGCDNWHAFEWGGPDTTHGFKWEKVYKDSDEIDFVATAKTVYYQCPHCPHKHYYKDLKDLDDNRGEWRSENLRFDDNERKYYSLETGEEMPSPYSVGIQLRGWLSRRKHWWRGVLAFLQAVEDQREGKPAKMVDWTQDYEAMAYRRPESADYIRHGYLAHKQEHEPLWQAEVPDEVQAITIWWDVQVDRIEGLVCGWGYKEECWLLERLIRLGDPATTDVLEHIQTNHQRTFTKSSGYGMPVTLSGVDVGYLPDRVSEYCTGEWKTEIIPTMGDKAIGKPVIMGASKTNKKRDTFQTTLCVDSAKDIIYKRYVIERPGPGYIHIKNDQENFPDSFLKQMVAEIKKSKAGGPMRWTIIAEHMANEALDMMVGNLALVMMAQQRFGLRFVPPHEYQDTEMTENPDMSIEEAASVWAQN